MENEVRGIEAHQILPGHLEDFASFVVKWEVIRQF